MVDTVGNRLGPRKTFVYEADNSVSYNIRLDESVATAIGNVPSTNGNLPVLCSGSFPIAARYVNMFLKSNPTVKKRAVVCDPANSNWVTSGPTEVTINGQIFVIQSRIGEKRQTLIVDDPV